MTSKHEKDENVQQKVMVAKKYNGRRIFRYQWWKGLIDFLCAFFALVILSPFMLLIAIVIKIDSRGEIIYRL